MTNPLRGWYSDLFGSRGVDVASALEYVDQLASASSDPVAVQTAARVLLNTVIGAVDQILNSRSPERLALIELIDERIASISSARATSIRRSATGWTRTWTMTRSVIGCLTILMSRTTTWTTRLAHGCQII
jgi:hypothetical protein